MPNEDDELSLVDGCGRMVDSAKGYCYAVGAIYWDVICSRKHGTVRTCVAHTTVLSPDLTSLEMSDLRMHVIWLLTFFLVQINECMDYLIERIHHVQSRVDAYKSHQAACSEIVASTKAYKKQCAPRSIRGAVIDLSEQLVGHCVHRI